jgi:hypothetical protein
LLRRRSLHRRLEALDVPLSDMKKAAKSVGCSVNDAYIAALCGALRLYHDKLGVPIDALPLVMPVSVRSADDPAGGNRWAALRLAAPIGEADPTARMRTIRQLVRSGRSEPAIAAFDVAAPILARAPIEVLTMLAAKEVTSDVQASNVPGHSRPTYIAGARILRVCPFGPITGAAMMVVMFSLADTCFIGVHYDPASVTEQELFAWCLREGFREVLEYGD